MVTMEEKRIQWNNLLKYLKDFIAVNEELNSRLESENAALKLENAELKKKKTK